jgi:glyoxylase-like metal-dependent hydrolase (beta-lactamase superfamily II)
MTSIPFRRDVDFEYGKLAEIAPGVRRMIAQNPGPFTFLGTGVYIIGYGHDVAVIDPGPDDATHRETLFRALDGLNVTHIFVTHHHLDHSPMARPLSERTGANIYGFGVQVGMPAGGDVRLEAGDDLAFRPDIEIRDGQIVKGNGWTIEAVHTPGHTSNHTSYAFLEENLLFCGDHVMAWSTTVISPPDGHMGDYLASLKKVRDRDFSALWPTHGPQIDAPGPFIDAYLAHRAAREAQILAALRSGHLQIKPMVADIYAEIDRRLHPAACHSVLAHLIHMVETGRVMSEGAPQLDSRFRLAEVIV